MKQEVLTPNGFRYTRITADLNSKKNIIAGKWSSRQENQKDQQAVSVTLNENFKARNQSLDSTCEEQKVKRPPKFIVTYKQDNEISIQHQEPSVENKSRQQNNSPIPDAAQGGGRLSKNKKASKQYYSQQ